MRRERQRISLNRDANIFAIEGKQSQLDETLAIRPSWHSAP